MTAPATNSALRMVAGTIVAITAWFALLLQLYLSTGPVANFLSYFTILSNLLVAVGLTCSTFVPGAGAGRFFSRPSVQTALALYIFVVGLVYNLMLRGLLVLESWRWIVDNILHVAVPVMYVLYWFFFTPGGRVQWKDGLYWLLFPLLYLVYSLVRGPLVNWYPYPFLNVGKLGMPQVLMNSFGVMLAFLVTACLLILLNRYVQKKPVVA